MRIGAWLGGVAALLAVLELAGVPVLDWIDDLLDKVAAVPAWAIAAGVALESLQTSLAALAWYGILRAALPRSALPFRFVLASYAAAVALNTFLPANIGTFVMLVMFTTLIVGATFPLVISGLIVEKIPFSVFNIGLYLYLFLTVSGSFSLPGESSSSSSWPGSSGSAWRNCVSSWSPAGRSCARRGAPSPAWSCPS